ncbi:hypothetical protein NP493_715g01000 [Ridgeia piscesae]|uniref:Uncharacterized protein n=1 Tax=Ridgeia piscesae TaxID=27915 RepID=A0AAD9KQT2_RIDPI|nr:hypothetical protein NP493_715g01000 [Ridgeia piscesae]
MPCGGGGYARGFGARFCWAGAKVTGLTTEASEWFIDVQRCIMEAVLPHYSDIDVGCDDMKEIALYVQIDCFTGSDMGSSINKTLTFCRVVANLDNWKTILNILKSAKENSATPAEFVKTVANDARVTLTDAGSKCFGLAKELVQNVTKVFKDTVNLLRNVFNPERVNAVQSDEDCMALAEAHNCSFYECFERRFPCKSSLGISHVIDFEMPSCRVFYGEYDTFDKQGQEWLDSTQLCLMKSLQPLLNASSIDCHDLHGQLFTARLRCYVNSGFCNVTDATPNRWAIDRSLQDDNFPVTRSLKPGLDLLASNYYHAEVILLQRLSGYAHLHCFKDDVTYKLRKLYDRVRTTLGFMNFEKIAVLRDKIRKIV